MKQIGFIVLVIILNTFFIQTKSLSFINDTSKKEFELTLIEVEKRRSILESMLSGDIFELFKIYHELYFKSYNIESDEGVLRLGIFTNRVKEINEHNLNKENTWKVGLDQYSDLSKDEFKKNYLMDPEILKKVNDVDNKYFQTMGLNIVEYFTDRNTINYRPIDWSSKTGSVSRQGNCGCCYAMASINAIEANYSIGTGAAYKQYSRQQIVDCNIYTHGCHGGDIRFVPTYSHIYGLVPESTYPLTLTEGTCRYNDFKNQAQFLTNSMEVVNTVINKDNCGKAGLFDALTRGVVVVSLDADPIQGYKSGILDLKAKCKEVNHAVLLTGYGVTDGVPYWIIKNSWGIDFGYQGYFRVKIYDNPDDIQYNCYIQCNYMRPFYQKPY